LGRNWHYYGYWLRGRHCYDDGTRTPELRFAVRSQEQDEASDAGRAKDRDGERPTLSRRAASSAHAGRLVEGVHGLGGQRIAFLEKACLKRGKVWFLFDDQGQDPAGQLWGHLNR
jgi:hypothetical protein